jgi:hypothetical protein
MTTLPPLPSEPQDDLSSAHASHVILKCCLTVTESFVIVVTPPLFSSYERPFVHDCSPTLGGVLEEGPSSVCP